VLTLSVFKYQCGTVTVPTYLHTLGTVPIPYFPCCFCFMVPRYIGRPLPFINKGTVPTYRTQAPVCAVPTYGTVLTVR